MSSSPVSDRRRYLRTVGLAVAMGAALVAITSNQLPGTSDIRTLHEAVVWWTQGEDLYAYPADPLPPFAALLLLPLTVIPAELASWLVAIANLVLIAGCVWYLVEPVARRRGWSPQFAAALAIPAAVAISPLRDILGTGQLTMLAAALVICDLVGIRRGARWTGVGIGLATALTLAPALFIAYLAVTRQWRAAITATATALSTIVACALVAPDTSWAYWSGALWERARPADGAINQSVAGVLERLYNEQPVPGLLWFTFALLVLAVGLSRAYTAHQEGDELTAFTIVGLTAPLVAPYAGLHHLVWIAPAVLLLVDLALSRRSPWLGLAAAGVYAVALLAPVWTFAHPTGHHWDDGVLGMLGENSFALIALLLVTALPWRSEAYPAYQPEYVRRVAVYLR